MKVRKYAFMHPPKKQNRCGGGGEGGGLDPPLNRNTFNVWSCSNTETYGGSYSSGLRS